MNAASTGYRVEASMSTHDLLATFREAIQNDASAWSFRLSIVIATQVKGILEGRATQQAMAAVEEISTWLD